MNSNFTMLDREMIDYNESIYDSFQGYRPLSLRLVDPSNITEYISDDFMADGKHTSVSVALGDNATDADIARKLNETDTELTQVTAYSKKFSFIEFYKVTELSYKKGSIKNKAAFDQLVLNQLWIQQDREFLNGVGGNTGYFGLAVEIPNTTNDFSDQTKLVQAAITIIGTLQGNMSLEPDNTESIDLVFPSDLYSLLIVPTASAGNIYNGIDMIKKAYPDVQIMAGNKNVVPAGTIYGSYSRGLALHTAMAPAVIEEANVRYSRQEGGTMYGHGSGGFESKSADGDVVVSMKASA